MKPAAVKPIRLLVWVALVLSAAIGDCQTPSAEELVSLEVQNEPLGAVLERVAADTGCRFAIDDQWASFPVSARMSRFPLDRALKRILREFDHSIIFHPDRLIEIRVFGLAESEAKRAAAHQVQPLPAYPALQEPESDEPFDGPAADEGAVVGSDTPENRPGPTGEPVGENTIDSPENEPTSSDPDAPSGPPEDRAPAGTASD